MTKDVIEQNKEQHMWNSAVQQYTLDIAPINAYSLKLQAFSNFFKGNILFRKYFPDFSIKAILYSPSIFLFFQRRKFHIPCKNRNIL